MQQNLNSHLSIKEVQKLYSNKIPFRELDLLMEFILDKPFLNFITQGDEKIEPRKLKQLDNVVKRRVSGEPIAYIIGKKEFYSREFKVSKHTLIPRPESELFIDISKQIISKKENETFIFLDIGTGSGNLITTAYCEFKDNKNIISFLASDISQKALEIAKKNFKTHTHKDLKVFNSNLLKNERLIDYLIQQTNEVRNIIIFANLPYVDENLKDDLLKKEESRGLSFEPSSALWSSENGLWHYKQLINQIINLKTKLKDTTITALYEINDDQKEILEKFINATPYRDTVSYKDLSGKNRIIKHIY